MKGEKQAIFAIVITILLVIYAMGIMPLLVSDPIQDVQGTNVQLCYNTACFNLELAITPEQRMRGLMFRESLPLDQAMLFIFPETDSYSFRMKNTRIPLDIIRLDEDLRVVDIQTAQPCLQDPCQSYRPLAPSRVVLEINAGLSQQYGISTGSKFKVREN